MIKKIIRRLRIFWKYTIIQNLEYFFFDHYDNGVDGPGHSSYKEFKWGKLAFVISVITLISFLIYVL